jgi:hypothetical protein
MAPVLQIAALGLVLVFRVNALTDPQVKTMGEQCVTHPGILPQAADPLYIQHEKQNRKIIKLKNKT